MPIYAYRCSACGYAKDQLQKMSDPVLSVCPACGASTFQKQVTAAGFQLKGSGWYVTDFRGGDKSKKPAAEGEAGAKPDAAAAKGDTPAPSGEGAKPDGAAPATKSESTSATPAPPPPAPAATDK